MYFKQLQLQSYFVLTFLSFRLFAHELCKTIFQIRFSTFWLGEPIWPTLGPNLTVVVTRNVKQGCQTRQNLLKQLILKSPRFVPFGAKPTQLGCHIWHPWCKDISRVTTSAVIQSQQTSQVIKAINFLVLNTWLIMYNYQKYHQFWYRRSIVYFLLSRVHDQVVHRWQQFGSD